MGLFARSSHTPEDLAHGQIVIVTFRWIMVAAGFVFALWNPEPVAELRVQILVILALAVANFYLHAQVLRRRPALELVIYAASGADLAVITILVASGGGFDSALYIFYYPAVLVFSVAFPTAITLTYTAAATAVYATVSSPAVTESTLPILAVRIVALAGVAVCGNIYWRIESDRRQAAAEERLGGDPEARTAAHEAAEDLFFGQVVIIAARWSLILGGAIVVLWMTTETAELVTQILPVVALMGVNFFLHGRYLLERPANRALSVAAALVDLVVVTAAVLVWPGSLGLGSPFFVLTYPVLVAFAFVFPPRLSVAYTALALVGYVGACLGTDMTFLGEPKQVERLVQRLTTLAASGGLAAYYWRIQRARRRALLAGSVARADLRVAR